MKYINFLKEIKCADGTKQTEQTCTVNVAPSSPDAAGSTSGNNAITRFGYIIPETVFI